MGLKIKLSYQSAEDIPSGFEELYEERGGAHVLVGVEGMKTQTDVDKVLEANRKEKNDNKTLREKLRAFGDLSPDEVHEKLDKYDELAALAEGKGGKDVDALVDSKLKTKLAPLEREMEKLKLKNQELENENTGFRTEKRETAVETAIRKAAKGKVVPEAEDDVVVLAARLFDVSEDGTVTTRDKVGVRPGLDPASWLEDILPNKPHWAPQSSGGGAVGGKGSSLGSGPNPWSAEDWNVTEQWKYADKHGDEKAAQMARRAGVAVDAAEPAKKS